MYEQKQKLKSGHELNWQMKEKKNLNSIQGWKKLDKLEKI